ncbi:BMP family ABC transporter substrate-binding protein [Feifania hominis]|uniref:BMP family ABC transporter substrate-binding protein n=1 Tax=Feifania hominis TaxID=2763660 RepID=A0A926HUH8_9FIRM|nr:BMP family ABC transporter substrate-binding protein [Feifania hominis]MBC8536929.1 BMP family ABC transporter substrate-binding protein [Feifania hominis]
MSKRILAFLLATVLLLAVFAGCSPKTNDPGTTDPGTTDPDNQGGAGAVDGGRSEDGTGKACLITSTARGNEFIDLIWSGFTDLEKEGWEVKCIETFETAEQAEQVRSMCAEGYNIIYTQGDDVMKTVLDMQDELTDMYPDTFFIFLDTYSKTTMPNSCAVTIDPFEACFIAGYVAAKTSQSGVVGLMLPLDTPIMQRFEYGYYAGADYANNGTEIIKAYTNDWSDTTKGYESAKALKGNNPDMDVMIQAAYISGYGVIQACAEMELPCIGVDDWQGDIDPIVFWSAIKSMNVAVYETAHMWAEGDEFPFAMEFDLNDGGYAYEDVDLKNLSDELAAEVEQLKADIMSGTVDIFAGDYEEWRETNFDQEGE